MRRIAGQIERRYPLAMRRQWGTIFTFRTTR
jgi:hypothetical protein